MSECKQCDKGIESTGNRPKVFCSDKCRMAFNRTSLSEHYTGAEHLQSEPNIQSEQATPDNKVARDRVAQSLRDERQQGGSTATPGERSSSTGDPRDTESRGKRGTGPDFSKIIHDDPLYDVVTTTSDSTSRCFQDSGIPLPGDPGSQGREHMTYSERQKRYAHGCPMQT